jgi:hypothetical protein
MLQNALDLSRAAQQRGRWQLAIVYLRLAKDGIINAGIEQMEAIMEASHRFKPVSWFVVLLAITPGLLITLSRRGSESLLGLISILWYLYLGLLALSVLILWWKRRQFPVWGLLPAGALAWYLTYFAGIWLAELIHSLDIFGRYWMGIETGRVIIHIILAVALFAVLLRNQRLTARFWLVSGVIVIGNFLLAALFTLTSYGGVRLVPSIVSFFTWSGILPVEGLMLVAAGLLASRQHGLLALLVVVGGYSYMCMDSDYFSAFRFPEWAGLSIYLIAVTGLYLILTPVALLRARTRIGRALAVFAPVVIFHAARLIIPLLVIQQPVQIPWGDIILSVNVLLSFGLAWVLYDQIEFDANSARQSVRSEAAPLPN